MKKKEPKWMKDCRAAAEKNPARDRCSIEEFVAGAKWLSEYMTARRVSKGGKAREKSMTPERRKEIAEKAAAARWRRQ